MASDPQERVQPNLSKRRGAWFTEDDFFQHGQLKRAGLEKIFGPAAAIWNTDIPFSVGGAVDMISFERASIPGTVFVTTQLVFPDGQGPLPNPYGTYELVACTRLTNGPDQYALFKNAMDRSRSPYEQMVNRIWQILTQAGQHSYLAVVQPGDTCEIPLGKRDGMYILFDRFDAGQLLRIGRKKHHLLLCMEIFAAEYEYARQVSAAHLLELLKRAGHYPYSDLDRAPVV